MQPRFLARPFAFAALIALGLSSTVFAQVTYTLTSSGLPASCAVGLNASGQIIGSSGFDSFVWSPATNSRVDLDLGEWTTANGINDAGQVVGVYQPDSSSSYSAFVWTAGSVQSLSPLEGHTGSEARAINNSGVVVGASDDGGNEVLPVRWASGSGSAEALSTNGDDSIGAKGVNASGQMIGTGGMTSRAYFWSSPTDPSVLEPLAGHVGATAYGINASGQIVGESSDDTSTHAVFWKNASVAPINLCTISTATGSQANAINASGQVVGYFSPESSGPHGFLYSGASMVDLNSLVTGASGWTITSAVGINDLGWIAANATDGTNSYAVLLTPEGTAIPEPSTYAALLGVGVLGWAALKRRRRRVA